MVLGGWMRLWIVTCVLLGLYAGFFAVSTQPYISSVYESWCSEGVATLIPALERAEGRVINHLALRESLRDKGAKVCAERLRHIEAKRVDPTVSGAIALINSEKMKQEKEFPALLRNHWLIVVASWLSACAALWLTGWSVAWISRGFSKVRA